jgi:aspartate racemase
MIKEKIVGIIGGMGPEATVDLLQRILRLTPARDDADHIRCLVDNNPKIPSRIKAIIEGGGESPAPCLAEMARRLEAWGADFLAMPCNTAHYYLPEIQRAVHIPILDIIAVTLEAVRKVLPPAPGSRLVGLLASPALRITRGYEEKTRGLGAEILYPAEADQDRLFALIKAVKTGQNTEEMRADLARAADNLAARGASVLVIACTELGMLHRFSKAPVLDASEELAREIVRQVKGATALDA